jgi:penicillin G amidase
MKFIKHFFPSVLLLGLIYHLSKPLGSAPALGRFFSPFEGFMQNSESKFANAADSELSITGLKDAVQVKYDNNAVPHIFANNEADLYFAQGFVMAKDRIWQMEFYTLAAAGRISEIVGAKALAFDQYNRRIGMAKTAAEIAKNLKSDPASAKVMDAYTAGVNAYIAQLAYKNMPVEYKILGYTPSNWSNEKTILMLMNMRNTLSGGSTDYRISNVLAKYGMETVTELFTDYPLSESPIIPEGTPFNFTKVPVITPTKIMADGDKAAALSFAIPEARPEIGSNNWAVGGQKSATGLPILANDPHLNLTLPSIWYQMQLSCPGVNVYGVALPGCPGIVIGFNKDIAWGVTNVGSDVLDFYKIKFKDATQNEYWYNGQWKKTTQRIEKYKVKNGVEVIDTVTYTHHGPIIYNDDAESNFSKNVPIGHAMKWGSNESKGSDLMTFYHLNRAKNYADYRKALTYYVAPAQNFIFASNENDISITPNGKLPLKWKGQGKYVLDGSDPQHDWQGWIPADQNPSVKNPPRGFVSSANQSSTDKTYPYYMGWRYATPYRAIRINERLTAMKNATADSLRMLQNDNMNVAARRILPKLLTILEQSGEKSPEFEALKKWNFRNDANEVGATIFELWSDYLMKGIWKDEFSQDDKMMFPTDERTFDIIEQKPTSKWFDDITTKTKVESLADITNATFKASLDSLTRANGPFAADTWKWSKVKATEIKHLVSQFSGFTRKGINNGGGSRIVNATTKTTGPSWRMVVELDKTWPRGFGLYPGGQSGNPGSKYYDNMIDRWAEGKLDTLIFMKDANDAVLKNAKKINLKPKK